VFVFGAGNILTEIDDRAEAREVLATLESKQRVARAVLGAAGERGVGVTIGSENRSRPMRGCSVVSSPYWMGSARGAVGVIGPLRMEYPKVITLIDSVSRELTDYLARQGGRLESAN